MTRSIIVASLNAVPAGLVMCLEGTHWSAGDPCYGAFQHLKLFVIKEATRNVQYDLVFSIL